MFPSDDLIHRQAFLIGQIRAVAFSTLGDDLDRMRRIRDLFRQYDEDQVVQP